VAFDCDVTFGSSGAPVFQERNGRMRIVSVISAVTDTEEGPVSLGMDLPAVYGALTAALRAGRGVWPEEGGATRRLTVGSGSSGEGGGVRFLKP
jgi:protease YdgD